MRDIPRGIIASVQRYRPYLDIKKIAIDCLAAGSVAVRVNSPEDVRAVRSISDEVVIIGLNKVKLGDRVVITPTVKDALDLVAAGADYVAVDSTCLFERIPDMVNSGISVIGDVDSVENGKLAVEFGCSYLTTALCGYTYKHMIESEFENPDINTLFGCCNLGIPVIAEGRYMTKEHIHIAKSIGAHSVCIGRAICDPYFLSCYYASI